MGLGLPLSQMRSDHSARRADTSPQCLHVLYTFIHFVDMTLSHKVVVEEIKAHQRTLGAIDMESYAIAEVANAALAKEIPWLVVKGVQDFAFP